MATGTAAEKEDIRRLTLTALCDTLVPAVERGLSPVERAFYGRSGSALELPRHLSGSVGDEAGVLLDLLGERRFHTLGLGKRTAMLHSIMREGGEAGHGLRALREAALALFYSLFDAEARNPNWFAVGYPGPATLPPSPEEAPKTIPVESVVGEAATIAADVCVVGSGAGGSVIAAELQSAGLAVVILEAGGYYNEADFRQLELVGARQLYLGGGLVWSRNRTIGLLAGATLGGGTVVNSMVSLRPTRTARAEWAAAGLDGIDGPEFDADLDAVCRRLGVNAEATKPNRTNQLMAEALDRLGLRHELLPRNAALEDDARYCGYCNSGCQHGHKRSTLKTYLQDAADAGARVVVHCRADRVLVDGGQASGVKATVKHADGSRTRLTVQAPTVVAAAGGLGTPALLLRSGIGGVAAGRHLRLHPTYFVSGVYDETVDAWSGQFQAVASFDRAELPEGGGFLIESVALSPSFWAAQLPWIDGEQHKSEMLRLRNVAPWHAVSHDHGSGHVGLGSDGEPLVSWELGDAVDRRTASAAHVELARLHRAAGAREVYTFHPENLRWFRGEDFGEFASRLEDAEHEGVAFSAHQMGSARMGCDPETSVADGRGELHDTRGVWVGDAAALPSAPGVNPMVTIMALARRTAVRILERR